MLNFRLNYEHPWLLLLLIPAVLFTLIPHLRTSKKYRRTRNRIISITLHLIAMVLAINLLAGVSFSYEVNNDENELILLVDVSDSGTASREQRDDFVETVLNVSDGKFRIGIVKFGYGEVYAAPLTNDTDLAFEQYLSAPDPETCATDIESALKYAASLLEHPESGKIVLLSDGVETDGEALSSVIKSIAADGITVDTAAFPNKDGEELQILGVNIPEQQITTGEPISLEVMVRHSLGIGEHGIRMKLYDNGEQLGDEATVAVNKETQLLPVSVILDERGMHEIRIEISHGDDTSKANNSYYTYINLQSFENILLVERYSGESEKLKGILADQFKITTVSLDANPSDMPRNLSELAEFEQVILVNVAYSDMPAGFEEMLNTYVHDLGGGLFTVGGRNETVNGSLVPHAYNRADVDSSTYYKQMLPVNVIDYTPPIAVMIVVDTSASVSEQLLPAVVEGAVGCLDALNDRDFCGVMSFETQVSERIEVIPVSQKERIKDAIESIGRETASGGTSYANAIMSAGRALSVIDEAERKHIIIVSDGMPGDDFEEYAPYIIDNMKSGITMSILAIDVASQYQAELQEAVKLGDGEFYNIPKSNIKSVANLMQTDLALNAIGEIEYGEEFNLKIKDRSPILADVTDAQLPPLTGYYGTLAKEDARVLLMGKFVPILAQWKYGVGNVVSFMSDLEGIWSEKFIESEVGQQIILNTVLAVFPMNDVKANELSYQIKKDNLTTQLNVSTLERDHSVTVTVTPVSEALREQLKEGIAVTAMDDSRRFLFELKHAGLYEIRMTELDENGIAIPETETVVYTTFSYSEEYNAFPERVPLGEELLTLLAEDGNGIAVDDPALVFASFERTLQRNVDPRVTFLILVILLLLLDIAVRKFKFKWPWELIRERRERRAEDAKRAR